MTAKEREEVRELFTTNRKLGMAMFILYIMGSCGLNLQRLHSIALLLNIFPGESFYV